MSFSGNAKLFQHIGQELPIKIARTVLRPAFAHDFFRIPVTYD